MYSPIGIDSLSNAQISKLLKGHGVRVRHGSRHKIHVSTEQHKKIHRAHLKGAGVTLVLDPYQQQMHEELRGCGFFSSLKKGATALASNPTVRALGKQAAQSAINYGVQQASPYAAQYGLSGVLGSVADAGSAHIAGMGMRKHHVKPKPKHLKGKGFFGNVGKMAKGALKNPAIRGLVTSAANQALASQGLPPMAEQGLSMAGLGLRHKGPGRPRIHRAKMHHGSALYASGYSHE